MIDNNAFDSGTPLHPEFGADTVGLVLRHFGTHRSGCVLVRLEDSTTPDFEKGDGPD
ncbi:MAG: hypothetical protein AABP62_20580 [Planctomycetota bacterium]